MYLRTAFLTACLSILACLANTAIAKETDLTAADQLEIVEAAASLLDQYHLYPELAAQYAGHMREALAKNLFAKHVGADEFALALHRSLQELKTDHHLGVYGPERTRRIMGSSHFEDHDTADASALVEQVEPANRFFDIRYDQGVAVIAMEEFPSGDEAIETMLEALAALKPPAAVLFDLQGNSGGSGKLFRMMSGCFFDVPTPLFVNHSPGLSDDTENVLFAEPDTRCRHLWKVPMGVLVNSKTGSVAELMPFILQKRQRATIIGTTTLGAAHAAEFYELPHGFGMMIPVGRVFDPISGEDFEGSGVVPDIILDEDSDDSARQAAVAKLLYRVSGPQ